MKKIFNRQTRKQFLLLFIAVSFLASLFTQFPVNAFGGKFDQKFYSSNEVVHYNPTDTACGEPSTINVTTLTGATNREKIYNFWIAQGLTPAQSAGITGSLQFESGFSPFRQEMSQSWPGGGWGIAQFTGGQRTAATSFVKTAVGDELFNQYYKNDFGGGVNEASGFIPANVPVEANDKFLLGELNYLVQYTGSFSPSTISVRVNRLTEDYNISIPSGTKLLDFLKTVQTAGDVAKAWTYLYEYPADIKNTAGERGVAAEALLTQLSSAATDGSESCSVIGAGGLTFEQAKLFMKYYYDNRMQYFTTFWKGYNQSNQCTALVYYFNTRFITEGTGHGNGYKVVENLVNEHPAAYKSVDKDNIQPFSIFSSTNEGGAGPGHTGVILGIGDDGSIIIGEANAGSGLVAGRQAGLLEVELTGSKDDKVKGITSVEKWESIDAWIAAAETSMELFSPTFAAPIDGAGVTTKVQQSLTE